MWHVFCQQQSQGEAPLVVTKSPQGLQTIRLNRPEKLNSVTKEMYQEITDILTKTNVDDSIKMTLLTGTGKYFSAGNDLSAFSSSIGDVNKATSEAKQIMINFLNSFVDHEKVVVAGINGPSVGIMMTTLSLLDVVWASADASFVSPFSATAQSPEGGSTLTFPRIFGTSLANELLMFNRKISSEEALRSGFVSRIFQEKESFQETVENQLNEYLTNFSTESMKRTKKLMRNKEEKERLKKVIEEEATVLVESWLHPDFPEFIMKFMMSRGGKGK